MVAHVAQKETTQQVYDFTRFEIVKSSGQKAELQGSISVSPWQLVCEKSKLDTWEECALQLGDEVIARNVREPAFMKKIAACFPELQFFIGGSGVEDISNQTSGSLMSLYWIMT